jgi:hypothetical protein
VGPRYLDGDMFSSKIGSKQAILRLIRGVIRSKMRTNGSDGAMNFRAKSWERDSAGIDVVKRGLMRFKHANTRD